MGTMGPDVRGHDPEPYVALMAGGERYELVPDEGWQGPTERVCRVLELLTPGDSPSIPHWPALVAETLGEHRWLTVTQVRRVWGTGGPGTVY